MKCMALSIKNDETERLARQVARETGESLTEAIQKALQERWERLRRGDATACWPARSRISSGG